MKLKRMENGAYCFLVVLDPEQEEVRFGTIDPGSVNPDELILVPKSTLAGLLSEERKGAAREKHQTETESAVDLLEHQNTGDAMAVSGVVPPTRAVESPAAAPIVKPRRDYRDDDLLTRREAAEYLGVAEQTLAIWKSSGRYNLPCVKIGRIVRYRKRELDQFVERLKIGDGSEKRRRR
ncbi:MAG TPA: helix-turn-helix domain-containing protein [Candidatus Obscuribacterales bacterium]